MNRDILIQVTADPVVYPQTHLVNSKMLLYQDINGRCWKLIPQLNPSIIVPFIIFPISVERFEQLKEETK
jgi:hypothetical protein